MKKMQIGLYKDEYGDESKYKLYPCCEINVDEMTLNTDYTRDIGSNQNMQGINVSMIIFTFTAAGARKIQKPVKEKEKLLMNKPFWEWDDTLSKRNFMGQKGVFVDIEHGGTKPSDWDTSVYWKYYQYTADNNFEQYQNAPTTFNAGNVYYICPDFDHEPQKVFYAKNNLATCFIMSQFVGSAGNSGYGSGAIMAGLSAGAGLGSASSTARQRLLGMKNPNTPYQSYASGFSEYQMLRDVPILKLNDWTLVLPDPVHNIEPEFYTQLAHITYSGKEYIGWGSIRYGTGAAQSNPENASAACFLCAPIECFKDAIFPDPQPYENGTPAGNPSGMGGMGSGLPDGDDFGASTSGGALMPLGGGLHAYQVTNTDLNALMGYLWGGGFASGGLWEKFKNYKFNPIAGILSVHHIPYELQPTVGTNGYVQLAGLTFNGVDSGGTSISVPVIAAENHVSHFSIDPVYLDHEHGELPYFSFEDYARTRVRVYLPYCGIVELDPASCIGGCIEIEYQCDVINGNVGVQIVTTSKPDRNGHQRRHVSAVATGNCAYKIAMTGNDNGTGEILGAIQGAAGAMLSGNFMGALGAGLKAISGTEQHHTFTTGSISGNAGFLTSRSVIVEITYGDYFRTDGEYPAMMMRPAASSGIVSDFTGHCQCIVHADAITAATDAERLEIEQACKTGIIV